MRPHNSFEMSNYVDLIPKLPQEIAMDCLLRLPIQEYHNFTQVCRSWRNLIRSKDFIAARKSYKYGNPCACLIQALPKSETCSNIKVLVLGVTVFNTKHNIWERLRLPQLDEFRYGLPIFCQCCAVGDELFVIGGWDPKSFAVSRSMNAYNFRNGKWKICAKMLSERSFFGCAVHEGRIFVAGGHDNGKNALRTVEAYDPRRDVWEVMEEMQEERDECKVVAMAEELVVISGYKTEAQGQFSGTSEIYHAKERRWKTMAMVELLQGKPVQAVVEHNGHIYVLINGELLVMVTQGDNFTLPESSHVSQRSIASNSSPPYGLPRLGVATRCQMLGGNDHETEQSLLSQNVHTSSRIHITGNLVEPSPKTRAELLDLDFNTRCQCHTHTRGEILEFGDTNITMKAPNSSWEIKVVASLPSEIGTRPCIATSLPNGILIISGCNPSHAFLCKLSITNSLSFQKLNVPLDFDGLAQASCTIYI